MLQKQLTDKQISTLETLFTEGFNVMDTETTGLDHDSQPVSIGIMSHKGEVLLDTRIKPTIKIPQSASNIHGIYQKDIADAPTWADIHPQFVKAIESAPRLMIYNAQYDTYIVKNAWKAHGIDYQIPVMTFCAMEFYAEHWGGVSLAKVSLCLSAAKSRY